MSIPGSASPLFLTSAAAAEPGAFQIDRSLRFNSADSAYLSKTFASAGNRQTWTWSGWVKRTGIGTANKLFGNEDSSEYNGTVIQISSTNLLSVYDITGSLQWIKTTSQVFRDPSAWYHIVVAVDTTDGTAEDRAKVYVNGSRITSFSSSTNPSPNANTQLNDTTAHGIGRSGAYNSSYLNGYLADVHFIDGQALDPTDFGEYDDNNNWNPKNYSGTYGTNGFHLDFSDNTSTTTIAEDSSGNNNDWTANNISVSSGAGNDSMIDTPTNYTAGSGNNGGNYATLNSASVFGDDSNKLRNGNLSWSGTNSGRTSYISTIASDKFYYEAVFDASGNGSLVGVLGTTQQQGSRPGQVDDGYAFRATAGAFFINGVKIADYGSYTANGNSIIGVAVDSTAGTLEFFVDGTSQGTATSSLPAGKYFAIVADGGNTSEITDCTVNFGQRPFEYTPPTGFKSLCSTNLPDPTIADGSEYFDIALYAGTTQSPRTITGLNIAEPDFVWVKNRSDSKPHLVWDAVRGTDKNLNTTVTAHESDVSSASQGIISTSASNGFVVKNGSSGGLNVGSSGSDSYVAWCWEAGSSTASNTDGSITSSVRASQTAGFSIVSYTGTGSAGTVGHGLNADMGMVITKTRESSNGWIVWHKSLSSSTDNYLQLNLTDAVGTLSNYWGSGGVTSSVFGLGTFTGNNTSGEGMIAYCFAPVEGFSAFGSYTGNGASGYPDADGPFVYVGFRPRFVLIKASSQSENWVIYDTARSTFNVLDDQLYPNASTAETSGANREIDVYSNGFKIRSNGGFVNASGATYVYAAFAEHPFKTARAR